MNDLEKEIKDLFLIYNNLYIPKLTESDKILEYWENEFFDERKKQIFYLLCMNTYLYLKKFSKIKK